MIEQFTPIALKLSHRVYVLERGVMCFDGTPAELVANPSVLHDAYLAGNVGLLKHAANVPQSARFIEDIFYSAGFPAGVFQILLINVKQVQPLVEDLCIVAAALTVSEGAGRKVASLAGQPSTSHAP